jgi:cytochrome c
MQKLSLLGCSLLATLYGVQAVAAEVTAAPSSHKATVTKKKVKKAKKDCVEKDGKPCHLHQQQEVAAGKETKPVTEQINAPAAVAAGAAATSALAASAPAAAVKPPVKTEPAISETDALALAKKNNCLTCHAIDKKVVGPAWKDVAAKYRGDATAEAKLVSKIATGGKGVWGSMAMPAHPQISETDRKVLAKFVLSLK